MVAVVEAEEVAAEEDGEDREDEVEGEVEDSRSMVAKAETENCQKCSTDWIFYRDMVFLTDWKTGCDRIVSTGSHAQRAASVCSACKTNV